MEAEETIAREIMAHLDERAPGVLWGVDFTLGRLLAITVAETEFRYCLTFTRGKADDTTPDPWPTLATFAAIEPLLAVALADWRAHKLAKRPS